MANADPPPANPGPPLGTLNSTAWLPAVFALMFFAVLIFFITAKKLLNYDPFCSAPLYSDVFISFALAATAGFLGGYVNAAYTANASAAASPMSTAPTIPSIFDALKPTNYAIGGGILVFILTFAGLVFAEHAVNFCPNPPERHADLSFDLPDGVKAEPRGPLVYFNSDGGSFRAAMLANGKDRINLLLDTGQSRVPLKCQLVVTRYHNDADLTPICGTGVRDIPDWGAALNLDGEIDRLANKSSVLAKTEAEDAFKSDVNTLADSLKSCFDLGKTQEGSKLYLYLSSHLYCPPSAEPLSQSSSIEPAFISSAFAQPAKPDGEPSAPRAFKDIEKDLAAGPPDLRDAAIADLVQDFPTYQSDLLRALIEGGLPLPATTGLLHALSSADLSQKWNFVDYRPLEKPIPLPDAYRAEFIKALVMRDAHNPDPDMRSEVRRFVQRYPSDEMRAAYATAANASGSLSPEEKNALGQAGVALYAARIANAEKLPASGLSVAVLKKAQTDYQQKPAMVALLDDKSKPSAALMDFVWADLLRFGEKYMPNYPAGTFESSAVVANRFLDQARSYPSVDQIAYAVYFANVPPGPGAPKVNIRSDIEKGEWFAQEKIPLDPAKFELDGDATPLRTGPGEAYPQLSVAVKQNDLVRQLIRSPGSETVPQSAKPADWIFVDTGTAYGWIKQKAPPQT